MALVAGCWLCVTTCGGAHPHISSCTCWGRRRGAWWAREDDACLVDLSAIPACRALHAAGVRVARLRHPSLALLVQRTGLSRCAWARPDSGPCGRSAARDARAGCPLARGATFAVMPAAPTIGARFPGDPDDAAATPALPRAACRVSLLSSPLSALACEVRQTVEARPQCVAVRSPTVAAGVHEAGLDAKSGEHGAGSRPEARDASHRALTPAGERERACFARRTVAGLFSRQGRHAAAYAQAVRAERPGR